MPRSKKNVSFINFVNSKYRKLLNYSQTSVLFYDIDDYLLFLYFDYYKKDDDKYYSKLEDDLIEYSNQQQGIVKRTEHAK